MTRRTFAPADMTRAAPTSNPRRTPTIARPLGFTSLFTLGLNGIVGVGIFFAPSAVARAAPGGHGVPAMALTAGLVLPIAFVFVALARRFEGDGGPVIYARAAFPPTLAFAVGWMAYASAIASTASTCVGLAQALAGALVGSVGVRLLAAGLAVLLSLLCASGVVLSARAWSLVTVLKLAPLVALVIAGAVLPAPPAPAASALVTQVTQVTRAPSLEGASWLGAALVAAFSFQGFEIVPVIAGQTREARRVVPLAVVSSLLAAAALYVALQVVCERALGARILEVEAPLEASARALGGETFARVMRLATSVSAAGITFGMLAMTPRYLASLGDEHALPFDLARSTRGVPRRALAITAGLVVLLVAALGEHLDALLRLSSVAVLCQFASAAASLVVLAARRARGLTLRDAWPAPLALVGATLLLGHASLAEGVTTGVALGLGFALRSAARAAPKG